MSKIEIYIEEWEYLRKLAQRSIALVDKESAWDYRVYPSEFTISETFLHTVRAIFEDACNWFLQQPEKFQSTGNPSDDLSMAVDRMVFAISGLDDSVLGNSFTFPWGDQTNIGSAIQQAMFHAIGHFAQIRERAGILQRSKVLPP